MTRTVPLVKQDDRKGCGVACVAMVTRLSYRAVRRRALETGHWRPGYGMNGRMLQGLLALYRKPVRAVTGRYTELYTTLAIVKVNADVPHPTRRGRLLQMQHWVVWCDGNVYDPATNDVWVSMGRSTGLLRYLHAMGARTGRWYWL